MFAPGLAIAKFIVIGKVMGYEQLSVDILNCDHSNENWIE
jgi:hypothetical protein